MCGGVGALAKSRDNDDTESSDSTRSSGSRRHPLFLGLLGNIYGTPKKKKSSLDIEKREPELKVNPWDYK
tara:strand:+ start:649 stop:858 length:210 start_codon:yes stop_codon:yes gene_type:complete